MEPDWTKKIPSWLVCDWFYFFFIVNAVVVSVLVLASIYLLTRKNLLSGGLGFKLFLVLIQLAIAATSTLFYYLVCDRSLKPSA